MKYASDDPSSPDSAYQDATVQGPSGARREILELPLFHRRGGASAHQDEQFDRAQPEEVVKDMQAHITPASSSCRH